MLLPFFFCDFTHGVLLLFTPPLDGQISYYSFFRIQSKWVFFFFFFLAMLCALCDLSSPSRPGSEPLPFAVEVWSPNHWTTRKVPKCVFELPSLTSLGVYLPRILPLPD